jgi:small subunit ribosomal protein S16
MILVPSALRVPEPRSLLTLEEGNEMVKIRLRRMGATNAPYYRIVVSDSRKVPMSAAIEEIGYYDPRSKPAKAHVDATRLDYWVARGAQCSDTVKKLVARQKVSA